MVAAGVCHSDLHVVDGDWERPAEIVLGHEGAGHRRGARPRRVRTSRRRTARGRRASRRRPRRRWPGRRRAVAVQRACAARPGCALILAVRAIGSIRRPCACAAAMAARSGSTRASARSARRRSSPPRRPSRSTPARRPRSLPSSAVRRPPASARSATPLTSVQGSRSSIIGLGGVGLSALMAAVDAGAGPVIAVDVEPGKLEMARVARCRAMRSSPEALLELVRVLPSGGAGSRARVHRPRLDGRAGRQRVRGSVAPSRWWA